VTAVEHRSFELCLYRHDSPVQYTVVGRPTGPAPVSDPFDIEWYAGLLGRSGPVLRSRLTDPEIFAQHASLGGGGFADAFEPAPLDEFEDRRLLAFRR
jgi:hypothetical protein